MRSSVAMTQVTAWLRDAGTAGGGLRHCTAIPAPASYLPMANVSLFFSVAVADYLSLVSLSRRQICCGLRFWGLRSLSLHGHAWQGPPAASSHGKRRNGSSHCGREETMGRE